MNFLRLAAGALENHRGQVVRYRVSRGRDGGGLIQRTKNLPRVKRGVLDPNFAVPFKRFLPSFRVIYNHNAFKEELQVSKMYRILEKKIDL
jgi:hypothetical protein